jgi:hypothetical protein
MPIVACACLLTALRQDRLLAWEWQCALAESLRQSGLDPKVAHQGAARILKEQFGTDTTRYQEYRDLMDTWR